MAEQYPFLSDEWLEAAKKIREENAGASAPPAHAVRMNQVITDVPFGSGSIEDSDTGTGTRRNRARCSSL